MEKHRKRERPYEYVEKVRVTSVRVYRHRDSPCLLSPGKAEGPAACLPARMNDTNDATKIIDEEKELNALEQLAISQNNVLKV